MKIENFNKARNLVEHINRLQRVVSQCRNGGSVDVVELSPELRKEVADLLQKHVDKCQKELDEI